MKTLTFSQIKSIKAFADDCCGSVDWKELVKNITEETDDFELDNYRFIRVDDIDRVLEDYLTSDPYSLGCFSDWFIADNSDLSYDIVKALQSAEKFSEIGQHLIDNADMTAFTDSAVCSDGYGRFLAGYDGETMEDLLPFGYYAFRTN